MSIYFEKTLFRGKFAATLSVLSVALAVMEICHLEGGGADVEFSRRGKEKAAEFAR